MAAGSAHPAGAAGRIRAAKPGNLSGDYEVLDQSEQTTFSWSFSPFKRSLPPSPVLGCVAKRVRKPVLECVQTCPCKSSRRGPETSSNPTAASPGRGRGPPPKRHTDGRPGKQHQVLRLCLSQTRPHTATLQPGGHRENTFVISICRATAKHLRARGILLLRISSLRQRTESHPPPGLAHICFMTYVF